MSSSSSWASSFVADIKRLVYTKAEVGPFIVIHTVGYPPDSFHSSFYEKIEYYGPYETKFDSLVSARRLLLTYDIEKEAIELVDGFSCSLEDEKELTVEIVLLKSPEMLNELVKSKETSE